jgi:hypothetical protein
MNKNNEIDILIEKYSRKSYLTPKQRQQVETELSIRKEKQLEKEKKLEEEKQREKERLEELQKAQNTKSKYTFSYLSKVQKEKKPIITKINLGTNNIFNNLEDLELPESSELSENDNSDDEITDINKKTNKEPSKNYKDILARKVIQEVEPKVEKIPKHFKHSESKLIYQTVTGALIKSTYQYQTGDITFCDIISHARITNKKSNNNLQYSNYLKDKDRCLWVKDMSYDEWCHYKGFLKYDDKKHEYYEHNSDEISHDSSHGIYSSSDDEQVDDDKL